MKLPQPKTQNQKTLYWLIRMRSVTSIELRRLTDSSYPPARIFDVVDKGISILHEQERYKDTHISRYTLLSPIKEAVKIYMDLIKAA